MSRRKFGRKFGRYRRSESTLRQARNLAALVAEFVEQGVYEREDEDLGQRKRDEYDLHVMVESLPPSARRRYDDFLRRRSSRRSLAVRKAALAGKLPFDPPYVKHLL